MKPDEVVNALRACNRTKGHRCSECPVLGRYNHRMCKSAVDKFAADHIESLQAELAEYEDSNLTPAEVAKLAQAEPVKHGRWINGDCSVCKAPIPTDSRYDYLDEYDCKYCYSCGAKMDKESESNGE